MENQNYKGSNPTSPTTPLAEEEVDFQRNDMDEEAAAKEHLTSSDPTKVKFISANSEYTRKNGDAKVDIENVQRSVGMGKEELMKYANDPFWVRLRMSLFVLFWVIWVAMLVGSVVIIFLAPRCPPAPQLDWWQKTVVYQVMVGSYKDSNGDGRGDLQGLREKLSYLKERDINTLLLNPIFPTGSTPHGNEYEIIDFKNISSVYGTMEDFEDLIKTANEKDMKILLEFIPNQSSTRHPWFLKSKEMEGKYKDYYIWANGTDPADPENSLPNNWKSVHGGVAWNYDSKRKQFYLSQFFPEQADLNLDNENVQEELKEILEFWMDKGVDGFKINHVQFLFESQSLENEPAQPSNSEKSEYEQLSHVHTLNNPKNLEQLLEWRTFIDEYSSSNTTEENHRRIILTDVVTTNVDEIAEYYGNDTKPLSDVPYYFGISDPPKGSESTYLASAIDSWLQTVPNNSWPNWVLGSLNNIRSLNKPQRLATRVGKNVLDALHAIAMLVKGTPIVYYGDEIGMENVEIPDSDVIDHIAIRSGTETADGVKTPMQWSNSSHAGFTSGVDTFLPISNDYKTVNVESETSTPGSHLNIFKRLITLRKEPAIQFGNTTVKDLGKNIFAMTRIRKGTPAYLVLINFGSNGTTVDVTKNLDQMPDNGRVELVSNPSPDLPLSDKGHPKVLLNAISLGGSQTAVISFVPKKSD